MRVIDAINVNDAFNKGVAMLLEEEDEEGRDRQGSRGGEVIELGPVTTVYSNPQERVLWDTTRDCNPFFHLFESLWMLAGSNDVEFVANYNKRMETFSDDGDTFHGAYGFRWRHWFGFDQIDEAVKQLRADRNSRRVIVTMWSPSGDMVASEGYGGVGSKDLPCNLMIKFEIRNSELNMIIFNRSNDMIWGAYGANAVHFSVLQEYMAAQLGVRMGRYWQVSGNFHVYTKIWDDLRMRAATAPHNLGDFDEYFSGRAVAMPIFADAGLAENDIRAFVTDQATDSGMNPFFDQVAYPLDNIWELWKNKERAKAHVAIMGLNQKNDWVLACRLWMERRIEK